MTPKEHDFFESLIDSKFSHLETKMKAIDDRTKEILKQTTITNGRVTVLEKKHEWLRGVWYAITIIGIVIGVIIGAISTMLWH